MVATIEQLLCQLYQIYFQKRCGKSLTPLLALLEFGSLWTLSTFNNSVMTIRVCWNPVISVTAWFIIGIQWLGHLSLTMVKLFAVVVLSGKCWLWSWQAQTNLIPLSNYDINLYYTQLGRTQTRVLVFRWLLCFDDSNWRQTPTILIRHSTL